MAVSARDVAHRAGVSVSTVSRTLAKPEAVASATRQKVLAAAQELGYRTNAVPRSPVTGLTRAIGLVVPDLENPFFASVTKGVQKRAEMAGFSLLVADSDEEPGQEAELVRTMSQHVDGLLLCSPRAAGQVVEELAAEVPLVLVNRRVGNLPSVTVDNRDGVRQAIAHLRALGHRQIAYVGGPKGSWSNEERLEAFTELRVEYTDSDLIDLGSFRPYVSGGVAAADLVIASGATAVLTYNDLLALGILERARQRGVRIPEDLSVIGVDNVPVAGLTSPALTSVEIPRVVCGRAGVELLLAVMRDESAQLTDSRDLAVQLVVRDSTSAPSSRTTTPTPGEPVRM